MWSCPPTLPGRAASPRTFSILEIVGQDRPGIVRQISHALANFEVNVEELHTECGSAAMSGETLFKARARLSIPDSCNVADLRRDAREDRGGSDRGNLAGSRAGRCLNRRKRREQRL